MEGEPVGPRCACRRRARPHSRSALGARGRRPRGLPRTRIAVPMRVSRKTPAGATAPSLGDVRLRHYRPLAAGPAPARGETRLHLGGSGPLRAGPLGGARSRPSRKGPTPERRSGPHGERNPRLHIGQPARHRTDDWRRSVDLTDLGGASGKSSHAGPTAWLLKTSCIHCAVGGRPSCGHQCRGGHPAPRRWSVSARPKVSRNVLSRAQRGVPDPPSRAKVARVKPLWPSS